MIAAFGTLAAGLALATIPAPAANGFAGEMRTFRATASQLLGLTEEMLRRGEDRQAEAVLEVLANDPDPNIHNEARFRRAVLLASKGRNREAAILLRRILDERPEAVPARLRLAQALQILGDTDGALRELRAVQSNGLPAAVARLVDRYSAALRAQKPIGASLMIAIAPDSNINRATRSDALGTVLGDFRIAEEGKAKSGTGLSLNAQAFRRFVISGDSSLLIRASGFANLYRHARFNDLAADLAIGPEFSLGRDRLQLEVGATQRWFGQDPYARSVRLAGTYSHPFESRTLARVSGSAAIIDNQVNDLQDGNSYMGKLQVERALTPTMGVAVNVALDRQALKDPGYATRGWRAGLTGWHDLGRLTLTASAELGWLRADDRLWLFPDRRQDRYARYSVGASFRRLQYAGFAPLLQISVERNRSNIAFYDYRRVRTEIGIDRAF